MNFESSLSSILGSVFLEKEKWVIIYLNDQWENNIQLLKNGAGRYPYTIGNTVLCKYV